MPFGQLVKLFKGVSHVIHKSGLRRGGGGNENI